MGFLSRLLLLALFTAFVPTGCDDSGPANEPLDSSELQNQEDTAGQADTVAPGDTANPGDTATPGDTANPSDATEEEVWGHWFRIDTVSVGAMNAQAADMMPWDQDGTLPDVKVILYAGFTPAPSEIEASDTQNDTEYFNWSPANATFKVGPGEVLRFEVYDMDGESDDLIAIHDLSGDALLQVLRDRQGAWNDPDPDLFSLGLTLTKL